MLQLLFKPLFNSAARITPYLMVNEPASNAAI